MWISCKSDWGHSKNMTAKTTSMSTTKYQELRKDNTGDQNKNSDNLQVRGPARNIWRIYEDNPGEEKSSGLIFIKAN